MWDVSRFIRLCGLLANSLLAQELTEATYPQWKEYILANPEELSWKLTIRLGSRISDRGSCDPRKRTSRSSSGLKPVNPQGCV